MVFLCHVTVAVTLVWTTTSLHSHRDDVLVVVCDAPDDDGAHDDDDDDVHGHAQRSPALSFSLGTDLSSGGKRARRPEAARHHDDDDDDEPHFLGRK